MKTNKYSAAALEMLQEKQRELQDEMNGVEKDIQAEMDKLFDKDEILQAEIARLENGEGIYDIDETGMLVRGNTLPPSIEVSPYLETYLNDWGFYLQEGKYLTICCGEDYYQIETRGRDAGVYQCGKQLAPLSHFENNSELFTFIEKHMEKNGVFPEVVSVDRWGNITLIDTTKK